MSIQGLFSAILFSARGFGYFWSMMPHFRPLKRLIQWTPTELNSSHDIVMEINQAYSMRLFDINVALFATCNTNMLNAHAHRATTHQYTFNKFVRRIGGHRNIIHQSKATCWIENIFGRILCMLCAVCDRYFSRSLLRVGPCRCWCAAAAAAARSIQSID